MGLDPARGDHDRRLKPKGEEDALAMARFLGALSFDPGLVCTSTARRAQATVGILAKTLEWPDEILTAHDHLYLAEPFDLLRTVHETDDDVHHLALVGHNPGLEIFWGWLCGRQVPGVSTCGVVMMSLGVKTWRDVDQGSAELIDFLSPGILAERTS